MFRVLVYTWQPLSIAFAARALFLAVSCAQLDDFQLVETSPAPCLVVYLALSYNLFVSFALVWPGNGSFFFVPGNFPLYGLHNRYISSVCGSFVCACVGMHSKVCHAYHAAFSSFAQIFTFRNHILLLESHAEPEEEPNIAKGKR